MARALKIARVVVSVAVFLLLVAGLSSAMWFIPGVESLLCGVQLGPAVLGMSLTVIALWVLITLVFGRIYCSTVCPMGTLMDVSARAKNLTSKGKNRKYRYDSPYTSIRLLFLLTAIIGALDGFIILPSVLEPFNVFCRICAGVFNPLLGFISGGLAEIGVNSQYVAMAVTSSVASSIIALALFVVVFVVSMLFGRAICNIMCPVGTILGMVSRYSIFQFDIDTDLCTQCRSCEQVCKSCCIDMKDHVVDGSRCVVCFNCINVCPNSAIRYTASRKRLATPLMQRIKNLEQQAEPSLDSVDTISKKLKK